MIVREDRMIAPDPIQGFPGMVSIEHAALRCGCACYIGLRIGDKELVTASIPCSAQHEALMAEFGRRYAATEDDERLGDRLAVDVADQVLMAVAAELLSRKPQP